MTYSMNMNEAIDLDSGDVGKRNNGDDELIYEQTPHTIGSATENDSFKGKHPGKVSTKDTWAYFERYEDPKTKKWRARCIHCKIATYAIGNGMSTHGTTNLNRHVFEGGCVALENKDAYKVTENYNKKLKKKKFSQDVFHEKLGMAIIKHNYAFSFFEHEGIRGVFYYVNLDVKDYTRNTAKADILKIYESEKKRIKNLLANAPGIICLTSDVWSSITSEGFLSLTTHFIDENWSLHSYILNLYHIPPPHNSFLLSEKILEFLKSWGIENKIFSLTLDNFSSNDNMQNRLKVQLRNNLLCGGAFFHVRCSTHILNLIVQDGLKIANVALYKIKENVKYVKGSEGRRIKFGNCCRTCGMSCESGLRLDVTVRWNSTWKMLENVLKYWEVFYQFAIVEPGYRLAPTIEEWK